MVNSATLGDTVRMGRARQTALEVAGREVVITNSDKVFFPRAGHTKLDPAKYYAGVAGGALRGIAGRPIVLKRYVDGAEGDPFFSSRSGHRRRTPTGSRRWRCAFRRAGQRERSSYATRHSSLWIVNLGCIDLNPHPVRAEDLEHPDERRVDLDPDPGASWDDVRRVARSY